MISEEVSMALIAAVNPLTENVSRQELAVRFAKSPLQLIIGVGEVTVSCAWIRPQGTITCVILSVVSVAVRAAYWRHRACLSRSA